MNDIETTKEVFSTQHGFHIVMFWVGSRGCIGSEQGSTYGLTWCMDGRGAKFTLCGSFSLDGSSQLHFPVILLFSKEIKEAERDKHKHYMLSSPPTHEMLRRAFVRK